MADFASSFSNVTPLPPRVAQIGHAIFSTPYQSGGSPSSTSTATYNLFVGTGSPTPTSGNPGDWFISVDQGVFYQKTGATTWIVKATIVPGSGSVIAFAFENANGVSGVVTNPTTVPSLRLTLGAITPDSVNGVVFSGSSSPSLTVTGAATISGNNTGNQDLSGLVTKTTTVNGHALSSNVTITASDVGAPSGSGTSSGTNTGDQTTITGNAGTATKLQTARTINGVSFDGSADITIPAGSGTVTSIAAGTGLNGGTITTTGTISVIYGTIANTSCQGNDSRLSDSRTPTGSAGGDLTGTYPNPTLAATGTSGTYGRVATDSKGRVSSGFNDIVNVRNFGAVGNGSTDDHPAINAAVATLTSYSALYFPPGDYRMTSDITVPASLTNVTIFGEGATLFNDSGAAGTNTINVPHTCSFVDIYGINFTGSSSIRGSGCHIRMGASDSSIHHCSFSGCSEFSVLVSADTNAGWSSNVRVHHNEFGASKGDGCHVGSAINVEVDSNLFNGTGDDAVGVIADYVSYAPNRVTVSNNLILNAGSTSGAGIRIAEATDVCVTGNQIYSTVEAAIYVVRFLSTTAFSSRILIEGNKIYNSTTSAGPLAAITITHANLCTVRGNDIDSTANGGGISFSNCNNLVIQSNYVRNCPARGIFSDDTTTTNVANTWNSINIKGNVVTGCGTGGGGATQSYYTVPPSGKTITNLLIDGNSANEIPSGDYIYYDRVTTGKVTNNTSVESRAVTAGGTVTSVTAANNN